MRKFFCTLHIDQNISYFKHAIMHLLKRKTMFLLLNTTCTWQFSFSLAKLSYMYYKGMPSAGILEMIRRIAALGIWCHSEAVTLSTGLDNKIFQRKIVNIYLPINFSACFWCSKEPSHWDGSFEYPQHMFWLINKKIVFLFRLLNLKACLSYQA